MYNSPVCIAWHASVAGAKYRVVMREDNESQGKTIYVGYEAQCDLPTTLQEDKLYTLRIEHDQGPNNGFTALMTDVCLSEWRPYNEKTICLETSAIDGAIYYRFVVEDVYTNQKVVDRRAISPRLQVPLSRLNSAKKYKWYAQAYKDGQWKSYNPAAFLHLTPAITKAMKNVPEILFILSIDTEGQVRMQRNPCPKNVVEEQIFCKTPTDEVGINYQMDALEKRGGKGTFFIDILMAYEFGEGPTRKCINAIMERGHDIQLHLHPSPHLAYSSDPVLQNICKRWQQTYSAEDFRDALDLAYNLFYSYTGRKPVAFRNGAYHIQDDYFPILAEYGLMIDSTLYPYKNCRLNDDFKVATQPFLHPSGVLELPVGWLGVKKKNGQKVSTQFTVKFDSYGTYLQKMISEAHRIFSGQDIVILNFILHSYTFLKESVITETVAIDEWNAEMKRNMPKTRHSALHRSHAEPIKFFDCIHEERIRAFNGLLDAVADNPAIKIVTFKDIYQTYYEKLITRSPASYVVPIYYPEIGQFEMSAFQSYSPAYLKNLCNKE